MGPVTKITESTEIRGTKMGCILMRTNTHMKANPISAEDYLRNEVLRTNIPQVADRFNKHADQFA